MLEFLVIQILVVWTAFTWYWIGRWRERYVKDDYCRKKSWRGAEALTDDDYRAVVRR